jgi:hypothetical protein
MPEPADPTGFSFRHWVSFAGGGPPFALVLPDRRLYDAYAAWLRGEGPQGCSFPHQGQEMSVNFAHVQRMEVEVVRGEEPAGPKAALLDPVPLREPPPVV